MAAARYWRLVSIETYGYKSDLQLSEIALYENGVRVDSSATLTSTFAPSSGALANLSDAATGTVTTFAEVDIAKPSFALVWDFGSAVSISSIAFGAGASHSPFVHSAVVQYSSDGASWTGFYVEGAVYPGASTLGTKIYFDMPATLPTDPFEANVILRMRFDNASFADTSPSPKTITLVNGSLNTSFKKWGDAGFYAGPIGAQVSDPGAFAFGTGDFTIEFWFYTIYSEGQQTYPIACARNDAGGSSGWFITLRPGSGSASISFGGYSTPTFYVAAPNLKTNVWQHVAICRSGNTWRAFINGIQEGATTTVSGSVSTGGVLYASLGGAPGILGAFCYLDDVKITLAARYTANFAPPDISFLSPDGYLGRSNVKKPSPLTLTPAQVFGLPQDFTPNYHMYAVVPIKVDVVDGGLYRISGTVKEKALPANTPLRRRVRLHRELDGRLLAETWSDEVTGNYSFDYIRVDAKYFVVSFDYTNYYRAVIADNLTPEPMT